MFIATAPNDACSANYEPMQIHESVVWAMLMITLKVLQPTTNGAYNPMIFASPIILIATFRIEPYYDGTEVAVCFTSAATFWSAFYFIASITIFFVLPLLVLVLLYAAIACKLLRRHIDFHRPTTAAHVPPTTCVSSVIMHPPTLQKLSLQMAAQKDIATNKEVVNMSPGSQYLSVCMRKHRKQVIFMLIAVVASFFVCLLPFRAFTVWVIAARAEDIEALGIHGYYAILYFSRIMFYLNSALNPILYNLMSSKFRTGFWRLIVTCCGRKSGNNNNSNKNGRKAGGAEGHKFRRGYRQQTTASGSGRTTATTASANTTTKAAASSESGQALRTDSYDQRRRKFRRQSTFMLSSSISTSSGTERSNCSRTSSSSGGGRTLSIKRSVIGNAIIDITKGTVSTACPLESDELSKMEN